MKPKDDLFELTLPAEPEAVATARLFAVVVARTAGCTEDVVADVRIAVSEAVTRAVRIRSTDAATVSVRAGIGEGEGNVTFEVGGAGGVIGSPDDTVPDLSLEVIRSLFPVSFDTADGMDVLRFSTAGADVSRPG